MSLPLRKFSFATLLHAAITEATGATTGVQQQTPSLQH